MKPNFKVCTTPNSEIQDNSSVIQDNSPESHTEQPYQTIPTIPGLPPDLVNPSLMPFLTLLVSLTAKVLFPYVAASLKPQKTKLNPDGKSPIILVNFTFNPVLSIQKGNNKLPENKSLID